MTELAFCELAGSLQLGDHELISIVGGGGKTSMLYSLGNRVDGTTVLTSTTKMGHDQTGGYPVILDPTDDALVGALVEHGKVVAWRALDGHRALGVAPETCDRWFELAAHIVIEADGSRRRPFKAPRAYEPVIPSRTTMLIACIGAEALDQVIADVCHRPEQVALVARCSPADTLTAARAAAVLLAPDGSMKGKPPKARSAVVINKVDEASRQAADVLAELLAPHLIVRQIARTATPPTLT